MSGSIKRRLGAVLAASFALAATTVLPRPAAADVVAAKFPKIPFSGWTQTGTGALEGIGSWFYSATVGTLTSQVAPSYIHAQTFSFEQHSPGGVVGLTEDKSTGKTAVLGVYDAAGQLQTVSKPFNWARDKFYFPLVALAGGQAVGWVYDHSAAQWNLIGSIPVQAAWGKLGPGSVTWSAWTGEPQTDCATFPPVHIYRFAPVGIKSGGTLTVANATTHSTVGVGCEVVAQPVADGWVSYRLGTAVVQID